MDKLRDEEHIIANNLQVKWLVPLHAEAILNIAANSKR